MTKRDFAELPGMSSLLPASQRRTDAQVVRAVLAGQVNDFAILVSRYHARCLRVATHLLGDSDAADDAVQEAFVRAYRHLGAYQERDKFGAWLLRIVVNQCRSQSMRESRYVRFGDELSVGAGDGLALSDRGIETAVTLERRHELAHALAQLAPEQREAVVLRFADELSYDEIAALTGVGVSALKMRVKRGCARLRTLLSDYLHA